MRTRWWVGGLLVLAFAAGCSLFSPQSPAGVAPTPTSSPGQSATTTSTPAASPGQGSPTTGETTACASLPRRGFGKVWSEQAQARTLLGCPVDVEVGTLYEAQRFERGLLVWQEYIDDPRPFPPRGTVLVLFADDGSSTRIQDRWDQSRADPAPTEAAPEGMFVPTGRLGLVWREGAGVRNRLGWAIEPTRVGNAAWQGFAGGQMLWIPFQQGTPQDVDDRWVYAVSTANRWLTYKDTFQG